VITLDVQADNLAAKIKHYLITQMGKTADEANDIEFYLAFTWSLREEIMINWTAAMHTFRSNKVKMLYYFSMEYMPGRLLDNNIKNINATDLVHQVMKKVNRRLDQLISSEHDPGLGNGGLGRLASCLLDSLATQKYPAMGYGLRYQYGIFDQEIWCGIQVERPDRWLLNGNPWEFQRNSNAVSVNFCGRPIATFNSHGDEVYQLVDYEEVRALPYDIPIVGYSEKNDFSVLSLRLWSTKESPRNFQLQRYNAGQLDQAAENTSLTDVLYPNDNNEMGKRMRLKQEFLLVSASLQDIVNQYKQVFPDFNSFANQVSIQINDTHPALVIPELIRLLTKVHDLPWRKAWEIVQACCSYTNHTVLKEALEEWNQSRLRYLLPRQYNIIERLNQEFCDSIRAKFPHDEERVRRMSIIEEGQVKMAHLALFGSHKVNGVAALHTEILKKTVFKDFYEMYPDKFINITNGVTQRRWLLHANPLLAEFLTKRVGKEWITDFSIIEKIAHFASDNESQKEFLEIKKKNKRELIKFLKTENNGNHEFFIDDSALFDVHVKRIHEYKRQLMNALHLLMIYHELRLNPGSRAISRCSIFAGKAAPGYEMAKNILRFIYCLSRKIDEDPIVKRKLKVVFVENYNVSHAEMIIPAADLSEQISTAGTEASGTGNMKLAINGALTICTADGANIEMHEAVTSKWWPFEFGKTAEENERLRKEGAYNPWDIYMHHEGIRRALDSLRDHSLVENEAEHQALLSLYRNLLEVPHADYFFVLNDLSSYYDTQKKAEALYLNPLQWAEYALHNIAGMGRFSADICIDAYASKIWQLKRCPIDPGALNKVRQEFTEVDRCRIY